MSSNKRAAQSLALVHTDLICPMPVKPHLCAKYVLTFIDDHSGYALVAFLCNKDAAAQHFQSMTHWAETFTGQSLTSVHSDRGREFLGNETTDELNPLKGLTRLLTLGRDERGFESECSRVLFTRGGDHWGNSKRT